MSETLTKIGAITVESLNQLAEWHWKGYVIISSRPSTPSFWFFAAAIDANVIEWGCDHLSHEARALLDLGDVGGRGADAIEDRNKWCTCDDAEFHSRSYRGPLPEICWPCLFGCHERCSFGCSWEGEVHFPERLMAHSTEGRLSPDHASHQEVAPSTAPSGSTS